MQYQITAYSTALFSTWINIEELNLLFDAGDGLVSGLLQKSRKVKNVFISHADRDHLNGLPQFVQLNARDGLPNIYYPIDSGSFAAMRNFLQKFDPHLPTIPWVGIKDRSRIEIKKNIVVEALRNEHIKVPKGVHKSFGFKVFEVKHKLKSAFRSKSNNELKEIALKHGRAFMTEPIETNIISYSGDTPVDDYTKWDGSKVLIHEATFLREEKNSSAPSRKNKHSQIDEVLEMVKDIKVEKLILSHFSSRYSKADINTVTRELLKAHNIQIPVFLVYPGEVKRDILNTQPINT